MPNTNSMLGGSPRTVVNSNLRSKTWRAKVSSSIIRTDQPPFLGCRSVPHGCRKPPRDVTGHVKQRTYTLYVRNTRAVIGQTAQVHPATYAIAAL